jgi:Protein of unknown function (DUF3604)
LHGGTAGEWEAVMASGRGILAVLAVASACVLAGCGARESSPANTGEPAAAGNASAAATIGVDPDRRAYFGAVHVHTSLSFDAFTNGTRTMPEDAFRWAKGEPIRPGLGAQTNQAATPLDFYAVSDHAEMLGVFQEMQRPGSAASKLPIASRVLSSDPAIAFAAFTDLVRSLDTGVDPALNDPVIARSTWRLIADTADRYNDPGRFTTFVGFEWTSNPGQRNLHRIVLFGDTEVLPDLPFSQLDSENPEDLWKWLDAQRARGSKVFAITHNGNMSSGAMFETKKFDGSPIDAGWVDARMRNEPIYELTQIKGTSEVWPALSPTDEFANFELFDWTLSAESVRPTEHRGSYAREALIKGLGLETQGIGNPFKFGFMGDNDTHHAAGSSEEFNYVGKFGIEMDANVRLFGVPGQPPGQVKQLNEFSSGGLAGVWAESNTRESLFAAMQRKETFATSGTFIRVRLFGGFGLTTEDVSAADFVQRGYKGGVPMGGELKGRPGAPAPTFLVSAIKDPKSAHLDRVQIVKGWVDADGHPHEKIFDVTWSGERKLDTQGKLPAVGNTVDLATATYTNSIGAPELRAAWTDPDFDAGVRAVYYARVLEIPTPRWSTIDAVKLGRPLLKGVPSTIQERAWTSPVWYTP